MSFMLDKQFLNPLDPNATYIPITVEGLLLHGLFDKSSNVTLLNKKLAE